MDAPPARVPGASASPSPSLLGLPSGGPGTAVTEAPPCSPDGTRATATEPDAAMGLRAMTVRLANCGTKPFRLNGYPVLRVFDAQAEPLDITIVNGTTEVPDPGPKPLTVRPGQAAQIIVVWRNTVTDGAAVKGAFLQLVPAPGRRAQSVKPSGSLDLGTTGRLKTTAWALAKP